MKIEYKVTEISKEKISEYPWIEANFKLGEVGDIDDR